MKIVGVIPARLGSTRFPDKVLRLIAGKPMIQHVWDRAVCAKSLSDLIVACDDVRVRDCVQGFGGKAVLTSADHPNGTSRIGEIAQAVPADIFINIQGDEPLMNPANIDAVAEVFNKAPALQVATLAVPKTDREGYQNPNVVKAVCDAEGNALYFSRAMVPYDRDGAGVAYLKHLGIYAYRRDFLLEFIRWDMGRLEQIEKLEQLRILERGVKIRVVLTHSDSLGVDTPEDLICVENFLTLSKRV